MQLTDYQAQGLIRAGIDELQAGNAHDARRKFETVTATGRANSQVWLFLALSCRADHDDAAEEAAIDRLLSIEPRLVRGLIMKADCRLKAKDETIALRFYESALLAARGQQVPTELAVELQRTERWVAQARIRIDQRREHALTARGLPPGARSERFQQSLDILAGRRQIFVQEPTGYYFPGLPQIQFFEPEQFDWVPSLEGMTAEIFGELDQLLSTASDEFRPYLYHDAESPRVDGNHLLDNCDWSALFLCENGIVNDEYANRCPKTWEALRQVPLPEMPNSPTVMFSLLRPGARIAPHTGTHNARLICHLPLLVPEKCGIRVGNEVRTWEAGKLLIFDDSIQHEAWNDSNEDRVILIFDIWRPELNDVERHEVATLFAGPQQ